MDLRRFHKGCGGEIIRRKCKKCEKVWGRVGYYLASDIEDRPNDKRFDPKDYRKRIREGRDLP